MKKKNMRNFLIPKVINSIYPKMKYEDYQSLKNDAVFSMKTASVCEVCFLNLTRYCDFAKSNTENVLRTLRPKEIIVESKYMNSIPNNNIQNNFYRGKKNNINKQSNNHFSSTQKLLMKHLKHNLNIIKDEKFSHKKEQSHSNFYPKINNTKLNKLSSIERWPMENQLKDPDRTDMELHSNRTSIQSSIKIKK